jgi:hypothetical protein
MRRTTFPAVPLAILVACAVSFAGCTPPSTGRSAGPDATISAAAGDGGDAPSPSGPPGFDLDHAAATSLAIGTNGGRASVPSGTWTAMVAVPAGAAPSGAAWKLIPLRVAPAGIPEALAPGLYVDEAGQPPTGDCLVAFHTRGKADPDATIFRLSEDGTSAELVATDRQQGDASTILLAEVSGFSSYGVGKGSAAARDKAKRERNKQRKSHYVISVHDKVSFAVQDWKFSATLDMNLAGGGSTLGGNYKGPATLLFTGKYNKVLGGIIQGLGKIHWQGKGTTAAYLFGDLAPLVPLDDSDLPYQMEDVSGYGSFTIKGAGALDALARAPAGTYKAPGIPVKDGVKMPFRINVTGAKVTVEIANLGEFSGNLEKF